ncbi:Protein NLP8 [Bienertia sinuspersici]
MDFCFSAREKGSSLWGSTSPQPDIPMTVDSEPVNNSTEDHHFITMSEMMNLDGCAGWCNSTSSNEQLLASLVYSSLPSMPLNYTAYDHLCFSEQNNASFPMHDSGCNSTLNVFGSSVNFTDKVVFPNNDAHSSPPLGSSEDNDSCLKRENMFMPPQNRFPQSLGYSVTERMLRALSLFKESSGGGILAQLWVPVRDGDHYILSTCEQPYLLDQMLLGYREVSRLYTFSVEQKPGSFPGLPGRVYISKLPEWTSNVSYYSSAEYLRGKHAVDHDVRGSVAVPIFASDERSCAAVLELVTVREKSNFDSELESVCRALEAVDLRTTTPPRLLPQRLSINQRTALTEITDILRAVCHAHRLPLALTWIPCTLEEEDGEKSCRVQVKDSSLNVNQKSVLCIEESACYVNDKEMQGFVPACAEHYLEDGQGVAGKALQSNLPFFYPDVKKYHISEYPLVQHARKFGLSAAVAIRLRSTHTGNDDYILEFFLPLNITGNKEQQLLLDSLAGTMQRICRTLRTVTDTELVSSPDSKLDHSGVYQSIFPSDLPLMSSPFLFAQDGADGIKQVPFDPPSINKECIKEDIHSKQANGTKRPMEKKRSTAEKTVSLSVLQQYFSGSLKDAAKSIGVCPTTLKRICRQHGISRWPSRKINKVNRSLRKIQTVLDSVEGVEGGLKFDPTTGGFVAPGSVIQEVNAQKSLFLPGNTMPAKKCEQANNIGGEVPAIKLENNSFMMRNQFGQGVTMLDAENHEQESDEHNQATSSGMTVSSNASGSSSHNGNDKQRRSTDKTGNEDGGSRITIKATYKEDTVRFKFDPSTGCLHLYEEVANRFKIQVGTFQLKYLDDEEEWVMLVSDSDLNECLEIMEYLGKNSIKFLIRDFPCGMGSSGSSNCFLSGSC